MILCMCLCVCSSLFGWNQHAQNFEMWGGMHFVNNHCDGWLTTPQVNQKQQHTQTQWTRTRKRRRRLEEAEEACLLAGWLLWEFLVMRVSSFQVYIYNNLFIIIILESWVLSEGWEGLEAWLFFLQKLVLLDFRI